MGPAETNERQMRLRYPGICRLCGVELAERQEAIYERATRTVRCVECPTDPEVAEEALGELEAEPESTVQQSGAAGASALREYERRKAQREERIRTSHPKIGGLILALSDDPRARRRGRRAPGERQRSVRGSTSRHRSRSPSCTIGASPAPSPTLTTSS